MFDYTQKTFFNEFNKRIVNYLQHKKTLYKDLKEIWVRKLLEKKIFSMFCKDIKICEMIFSEKNNLSTGTEALYHILHKFPDYNISLTGFGYLKERVEGHYSRVGNTVKNVNTKDPYRIDLENIIIKKLCKEKKIKVLELS